jgi:hypothetical protein
VNALVTAAGQRGATFAIAKSIGRTIRARGLDATVAAPDEIRAPDRPPIEQRARAIAESLAGDRTATTAD